jgi:hypothetical protein
MRGGGPNNTDLKGKNTMVVGDINEDGILERKDLDALKHLIQYFGGASHALKELPSDVLEKLDLNGDGQLDDDDMERLCQLLFKGDKQITLAWHQQVKRLREKSC